MPVWLLAPLRDARRRCPEICLWSVQHRLMTSAETPIVRRFACTACARTIDEADARWDQFRQSRVCPHCGTVADEAEAAAVDGQPLLTATGQLWKLGSAGVSLIVGNLLLWLHVSVVPRGGLGMMLSVAGSGLALLGLAFCCVAVRCPRCGARWVWWAVSRQSLNEGWRWLTRLRRCPNCGYTPTAGGAGTS